MKVLILGGIFLTGLIGLDSPKQQRFLGPLDSLLTWPILWIKIMSNLNCYFKKSERMDNNILIFQWNIRILNKIIQPKIKSTAIWISFSIKQKKKERGFYFQVGYGKLQRCPSSYIEERRSNNLQNYYVFRGCKITSRTELQKVRRLSEERWDRWTP